MRPIGSARSLFEQASHIVAAIATPLFSDAFCLAYSHIDRDLVILLPLKDDRVSFSTPQQIGEAEDSLQAAGSCARQGVLSLSLLSTDTS